VAKVNEARLGIVACDVVRSELEQAVGSRDVALHFLPYSLHSTPNEMSGRINEGLGEVLAKGAEHIRLGYGLCSNGVCGVETDKPLVMPRCHDCVAMLLGSPKRYFEMFRKFPGTYFLTEGWIRNNADPLSTVEVKYAPRMGEKKAFRGMSLELANYKAFCFVDNGVGDRERVKARTLENCQAFKKDYMELAANLDYFKTLVDGPHAEDDFISLAGGEPIKNDYFYNII
jgi:hypothetical protein